MPGDTSGDRDVAQVHRTLSASDADALNHLRQAIGDRYEIGDAIGEGAAAIVFRARDLKHGRDVAIKLLRPEVAASVGAERFLAEVAIAARLSHPHVVALHDSGVADGLLYYVMPYVEGESLRGRLTRERQLPLEDAVRISRDLAVALQYAHERGVVHRDIKPENILLASDVACVADFGLATAVRGASVGRLTAAGIAVGTVAYMSPEQASGEATDGRADQYSLACVLFEMLAGVPPYQGVTAQAIIARHRTDPVPQIRHLRPTVPLAVDEVLTRALAKLPADRFQSTTAFAHALEAAVTANLIATRSTGEQHPVPSDQTISGQRRDKRFRLVMIAVAAVIVGVTGYALLNRAEPDGLGAPPGGDSLDVNRLAVAPFFTADARDSLWATGLVDLLSRNFDGAGPLRTVSPTVVIRTWTGRSDQLSAERLARRTSAALVIVGQLIPAGRDSARIKASLVDVRTGTTVSEVDVRDEASRVERLADSLTVAMLRDLGRIRAIAAVPRSSIGSRSLGALKAFLQGEQHYRANELRAARDSYERAIAQDSSFALAYRRMRSVLRAIGAGESDPLSFEYATKAGVRNRGLAPRDSLLIVADSLAAAFSAIAPVDGNALDLLRRRLVVLNATVDRYPDDPEGWYELGEFRHHYGERFALSQEDALDAFERSIGLDSAFAPPYYHLVELAPNIRGVTVARRQTLRYLATNPADDRMRLIAAMFDTTMSAAQRSRLLDSASAATLSASGIMLRRWADKGETARQLLERQLTKPELSASDRRLAEQVLALTLLYRGHLTDAYRLASPQLLDSEPFTLVFFARFGAVPDGAIDAYVSRWAESRDFRRLAAVFPLAAVRSDSALIARVTARCDSAVASYRQPSSIPLQALYCVRSGNAHLKLVTRDSTGAARAFAALPDTLCPLFCSFDRFTAARLLTWSGRPGDAARMLDRNPPLAVAVMISEVIWALERARLAAILGDSAIVRQRGEFVRAAWINADPPLVAAIRDAGLAPGSAGISSPIPRR